MSGFTQSLTLSDRLQFRKGCWKGDLRESHLRRSLVPLLRSKLLNFRISDLTLRAASQLSADKQPFYGWKIRTLVSMILHSLYFRVKEGRRHTDLLFCSLSWCSEGPCSFSVPVLSCLWFIISSSQLHKVSWTFLNCSLNLKLFQTWSQLPSEQGGLCFMWGCIVLDKFSPSGITLFPECPLPK